ncbi:Formate dehydrogenase H [invertebrate metagenome]|uniref:Formate dehydrogenase H n=1 Tax=invertebrate metagenome TaxID=1711999 RepID=A0A2H9T697_9ZZZZ
MTNSFEEFEKTKLFIIIGSNMLEAHPVAATFLKKAVQNGTKLILIDPRKQKLLQFADTHIQLKCGTDVALINALMHVLIRDQIYDKNFVEQHCENFEALKEQVAHCTPEYAADICGITPREITDAAHMMASIKPAMLCYTLGLTEHISGTDNVLSVANLQMLLGNMGQEGGGVNPLRGQNNVQGACDMAALPNYLPGYGKFTDPITRQRFADFWQVPSLPSQEGLKMPQMFEGMSSGKIRGMYIFGENVANTEPDTRKVEEELSSVEFLVCQDIFLTETTRFADVVFPAAAWSEKDGTFTSSERRVNRVRAVSTPPGDARPDWWIFKEIATRFGHQWPSSSAKDIWDNEISQIVPTMRGIKYDRIKEDGLQWPCTDENHPGTPILHKGGQFTRGKGHLTPIDFRPPAELPDEEYPLVLSTGRRLPHYHTRTQTGNSIGLNDVMSREWVDISPQDADRLRILEGETVTVSSRRGSVEIIAHITDEVPKGMVWMTFHFRKTNANWLTNPAFDPETLTAEYKVCTVRIDKKSA